MAQINDLIGDLLVAPARILFFETNHKIDNLLSNRGARVMRKLGADSLVDLVKRAATIEL